MIVAIVAAGVWSWARGPLKGARFPGYVGSAAAAQDAGQDKSAAPAEQYKTLLKEFSAASQIFWQATTDEERNKIVARVENLPLRLLDLARNNPKDPIALDALIQVVTLEYWLNTHTSHPGWGEDSRQATAIVLMLRDHLHSDKLGETCNRVHYGFRHECETFLRTVLEKNPHREVRGLACLRLAQFLPSRLERLDLLKDQPELARRYEGLFGKNYLKALQRQDRAKVMNEAETLYEQAIEVDRLPRREGYRRGPGEADQRGGGGREGRAEVTAAPFNRRREVPVACRLLAAASRCRGDNRQSHKKHSSCQFSNDEIPGRAAPRNRPPGGDSGRLHVTFCSSGEFGDGLCRSETGNVTAYKLRHSRSRPMSRVMDRGKSTRPNGRFRVVS